MYLNLNDGKHGVMMRSLQNREREEGRREGDEKRGRKRECGRRKGEAERESERAKTKRGREEGRD